MCFKNPATKDVDTFLRWPAGLQQLPVQGTNLPYLIHKEWELEKETTLNAESLSIKSSGINFVFLPAFYLIIWPMTHQRIFSKIAILKI